MERQENQKTRKILCNQIIRRAILIFMGFFLGVNIYLANARGILGRQMPMPFGYGIGVVLSGSMEPSLSKNDLIIVKESKELQEKPMPEVTAFLEEKGIYDPEFLWGLYKKVIEDKLPALLSSLKLSLVVEERINAMQVEEVEELVLSIMNKELGAIVNLGAVIGLILGLINVIIFII